MRIRAAGEERSARLAEVARPDEMVAAEVVVTLAESPGDRQARDDAAGKGRSLVAAQNGGADPIEVMTVRAPLERSQPGLPGAPAGGVVVEDRFERRLKRAQGMVARLGLRQAESEGENRGSVRTLRQLGRHCDVAVGGGVVLLGQPAIFRQLLPAVRDADEADRTRSERLIGGHRQKSSAAGGEQHAATLVVATPAIVVGAGVDEMGRDQRKEPQSGAGEVLEADLHQHRAAARIGDHALDDAEPAPFVRARQQEGRDAVLERLHRRRAVPLFLGEEARAVGDDQAEVANAGLIDSRVVDFIEDAVADGEPDPARVGQSRADPALRARRPARRNPRPARRFDHGFVPRGAAPARA